MTEKSHPIVLKSFLETCMKLLRDQKVVEGIPKLIDNYASKDKSPTKTTRSK